MTFRASLHRHMTKRRLTRRLSLLKTARQKLMAAAACTTGPRAAALADLAACADMVAACLWPVWRGL